MSLMDILMEGSESPSERFSMLSALSTGEYSSMAPGGSQSPVGGPTPGGPQGWINQALDITNSPDKWSQPLYELMMRESGGDPNARNDTPVASGQHAQGLFQTIPSTFAAHDKPRLGGINDPVSNAVAAIRYIIGRYGTPYNLPESGGY